MGLVPPHNKNDPQKRKKHEKGHKSPITGLYPKENQMLKLIKEGNKPDAAAERVYGVERRRSKYTATMVLRRERFQKALEKAGLTDKLLSTTLVEGLQATKPIILKDKVIDYADHGTRHSFLKTALEVKGYLTKEAPTDPNGEPLVIGAISFNGPTQVNVGVKKKE